MSSGTLKISDFVLTNRWEHFRDKISFDAKIPRVLKMPIFWARKFKILLFIFAVDIVDPAIRHENGKQVARWNVDPSYEMSTSGYTPNSLSSGGGHAPHPAAISANRTQAFTTQPHPSSRHHPNGEFLKRRGNFAVLFREIRDWNNSFFQDPYPLVRQTPGSQMLTRHPRTIRMTKIVFTVIVMPWVSVHTF